MSRVKEQFEQWQQEQQELEQIEAERLWDYAMQELDKRGMAIVSKDYLTENRKGSF